MKKDLYLTNEQYQRILGKIRATLSEPDFQVACTDCTLTGSKSTDSNCGFCNDNYTEEDTALFPAEFPKRGSMKYRQEKHRCPFDRREYPGVPGWSSGCFPYCYLFGHLRNKDWDTKAMRNMVNQAIQEEEEHQADKDIAEGNTYTFDTVEDLFIFLHKENQEGGN